MLPDVQMLRDTAVKYKKILSARLQTCHFACNLGYCNFTLCKFII